MCLLCKDNNNCYYQKQVCTLGNTGFINGTNLRLSSGIDKLIGAVANAYMRIITHKSAI